MAVYFNLNHPIRIQNEIGFFTFAPDKRHPRIKLAWFNSSDKMRQPGPTIDGIFIEFVANPIPNVKVSSTPRNLLHLIKIM